MKELQGSRQVWEVFAVGLGGWGLLFEGFYQALLVGFLHFFELVSRCFVLLQTFFNPYIILPDQKSRILKKILIIIKLQSTLRKLRRKKMSTFKMIHTMLYQNRRKTFISLTYLNILYIFSSFNFLVFNLMVIYNNFTKSINSGSYKWE